MLTFGCRIQVRTRDFVASYLGPNFTSSTQPRKPKRFDAFARKPDHRTRQANTFLSCVCEPPDLCQQYIGTFGECFQLVSERTREREWQTAARRLHLSYLVTLQKSYSHFLQSSEILYPIDAGSTVTRLVHSQSVGCSLEHFCCCKVIEIPDLLLWISCGQELVDPLTPALVREDRPIADSCYSGSSSFGSCDTDRPTREKWHKRWGKIIFFLSLSMPEALTDACKMRVTLPHEDDSSALCWTQSG